MVTKRCNWYTLSSPLSVLDPGRNGSQLINLSWRNSSTPCGEDVFIQECRYNSSWYGTDPVNLERGGEKIKKASLTKLEAASVFNVLTVYLLSWAHKMDPWELHLFFCSKFGLSLSPFGELWSSPLAPNKWSFLKSSLFFHPKQSSVPNCWKLDEPVLVSITFHDGWVWVSAYLTTNSLTYLFQIWGPKVSRAKWGRTNLDRISIAS